MGYVSPVAAHYIVIPAYVCGLGLFRERTIARSHVAGSGSALITETQPGIMAECSSCIAASSLYRVMACALLHAPTHLH